MDCGVIGCIHASTPNFTDENLSRYHFSTKYFCMSTLETPESILSAWLHGQRNHPLQILKKQWEVCEQHNKEKKRELSEYIQVISSGDFDNEGKYFFEYSSSTS